MAVIRNEGTIGTGENEGDLCGAGRLKKGAGGRKKGMGWVGKTPPVYRKKGGAWDKKKGG